MYAINERDAGIGGLCDQHADDWEAEGNRLDYIARPGAPCGHWLPEGAGEYRLCGRPDSTVYHLIRVVDQEGSP